MRISVIDSHTGGEPTRVVLDGIALRGESMFDRRRDFEARFDHLRTGIILEPRGSDVLVGALLTEPVNEGSAAGVIFFNNAGYLGMCGHGTIGVVETLRHLGRMEPGTHHLDTPVGTIAVELRADHQVVLTNVLSYRLHENVAIDVEGMGTVTGDVAYGGNWFFVVHHPSFDINLAKSKELTGIAQAIKQSLIRAGITGHDGAEIDHVELAGPSVVADSRNFVLCPGGAYDRSPCGTGTSAKMACLAARGELLDGAVYRQESVTGSIFQGSVQTTPTGVIPTIIGRAHITAESTLIFEDDDPLRWGLNP